MKNIFKDYTFKWWEVAILKIGLFLTGIIIGAYMSEFVTKNVLILVITAAVPMLYTSYVAFRQK